MLKNVKRKASDMRQRQVGDNPVLGSNSFGTLAFCHALNSYGFPAEVVVAEHTSFGVACRATGVDEAAALTGLLLGHLGENDLVFHRNA